MPVTILNEPLAVEFVFTDATRYTASLAGLPCPRLAADLAVGLAGVAHPHGEVDARTTARSYRRSIIALVEFLAGVGFTGGAGELTKTTLVRFWLSHKPDTERNTRMLLRGLDRETGVLRPEVREYLAGPKLKRQPDRESLPPYSDGEWARLLRCCQDITREAFTNYRAALAGARSGQDPRLGGWEHTNNRLWLLRQRGPLTRAEIADYLGRSPWHVWSAGGSQAATARPLFPTTDVTLAYRLLLGMTSGIVPDGLDDLELDDVDWAGDTTILLDYMKGRTGPESLNLPSPAVGVLQRWLRHSALIRRFVDEPVRSALWLAHWPMNIGGGGIYITRFDSATVRAWVQRNDLRADGGAPLPIHKHRIRTTFENRRDKSAWTGRTTIDPNHSSQVEGDHYLSRPTPAQRDALDAVIEEAQTDLVRKAHTPLVLTSENPVTAAAELPSQVDGLDITDTVIVELVGGRRDVFTAACVDQLAGVHGPAGKPCPARPWVCLLCPLAVFAPRHAPNLLRLKAFFARQFRQMTVAQFMAVFGPYAHRLDTDILPRFSDPVLAAAAETVEGRDDELPLRPEETTA